MRRLLLIPILLFLAVPVYPTARLVPDDPIPMWREGPVRYILNVKEDAAYRKLKTREERREFIAKFWAALDPTPDTEVNERRRVFWDRVEQADQSFHDSVYPGWKTDRGKILILLGPPDYLARRERGEVWTYRALPQLDAPPEILIGFYQGLDSEYHMAPTSLRYHPMVVDRAGNPVGENFLGLSMELAGAQILEGRIRLPETPPGKVEAEHFFGRIAAVPRYTFFKAADGSTFVSLTVSVSPDQLQVAGQPSAPTDLTLSTTVVEADSGKPVSRFTKKMRLDSGWKEGSNRPMLFETGFDVRPGVYRVDLILVSHPSLLGTTFSDVLHVPDFRRGMALSDIVVGHPREEPAGSDPFHLGKLSPLPDPLATFHSGETVQFSYQVYNAEHRGEEADLDAEYRFLFRLHETLQTVGHPVVLHHLKLESLAYSLPLTDWPEGEYRIQICVTDNLSGSTASREESFHIVGFAAGPSTEAPPPP